MKTFLVICAIVSVFTVQAEVSQTNRSLFFMSCLCPLLNSKQDAKPIRAIAVLSGANIKGNVTFTQNGCGQPVTVEVSIYGLNAGDHGFHVHEKGDLSEGCASLGAHYNPDKVCSNDDW